MPTDAACLSACNKISLTHPQMRFSQWAFLLAVRIKPGSTLTELARELDCTLAAVSRAVDVFGKKGKRDRDLALGFVETRRDPSDDRIQTVHLTKRGDQFLNMIQEALDGDS